MGYFKKQDYTGLNILSYQGVSYLLQTQTDFKLFNYVLPYVKIFARVSPKQKVSCM